MIHGLHFPFYFFLSASTTEHRVISQSVSYVFLSLFLASRVAQQLLIMKDSMRWRGRRRQRYAVLWLRPHCCTAGKYDIPTSGYCDTLLHFCSFIKHKLWTVSLSLSRNICATENCIAYGLLWCSCIYALYAHNIHMMTIRVCTIICRVACRTLHFSL